MNTTKPTIAMANSSFIDLSSIPEKTDEAIVSKPAFELDKESIEFQDLPNWVKNALEERLALGEEPSYINMRLSGSNFLTDEQKENIRLLMLEPQNLTYEDDLPMAM